MHSTIYTTNTQANAAAFKALLVGGNPAAIPALTMTTTITAPETTAAASTLPPFLSSCCWWPRLQALQAPQPVGCQVELLQTGQHRQASKALQPVITEVQGH
jgi:hypothetical protein